MSVHLLPAAAAVAVVWVRSRHRPTAGSGLAHPLHGLGREVADEPPAVVVVEQQVLVLRVGLDHAAHCGVLIRQRPAVRIAALREDRQALGAQLYVSLG